MSSHIKFTAYREDTGMWPSSLLHHGIVLSKVGDKSPGEVSKTERVQKYPSAMHRRQEREQTQKITNFS